MVFGWGYFIWTGSVETIWPMFGLANQLLALIALTIVTTVLCNLGRARYAFVTLLPMTLRGEHDADDGLPGNHREVPGLDPLGPGGQGRI